jgi:hypothetical protein
MWQSARPVPHWLAFFAHTPDAPASAERKDSTRRHATNQLVPTPDLPASGSVSAPSSSVPTLNPPPATPRPGASESAPAPSALALESAALERALTALRRDHDPAQALALLDRYAAQYPAGVLRLEADVAHLALHDEPAALALLERVPLERVGRGLELRLVRAELLAKRDCRSATLDFDRVLQAHPSRPLDERALYGRASCRSALGDAAGASADFDTYLSRYPNGRFAELARSRSH